MGFLKGLFADKIAAAKTAFAIAIACALVFAGWNARGIVDRVKYLELEQKITAEKLDAVEAAQLESDSMRKMVAAVDSLRTEEMKNAKAKIDDLNRRLRAGTVGLSVPIAGRCEGGVSEAADRTGMGDGAPSAEPGGSVGEVLLSIAADGDYAVIQLNACQDILEVLPK